MLELEHDILELKENIGIKRKKKVIAIIPARRGSKRIEGKNWRIFAGKALIAWTIEETLKCDFIDEIVISTDSPEIIDIVQEYEYDPRILLHERPKELATDNSPVWKTMNSVGEIIQSEDFIVILLLPTCPLRLSEDIHKGFSLFLKMNRCVISVYKVEVGTYNRNGAVYIDWFKNIRKQEEGWHDEYHYSDWEDDYLYTMPEERSVDLDTEFDFMYAENIMLKRLKDEG